MPTIAETRISARERKRDTRRKRFIGAMMLKLSDQHPNIKEFMVKHLDDFLEHPRDRKLFDLPPRPLNASRVTPKPANEGHLKTGQ